MNVIFEHSEDLWSGIHGRTSVLLRLRLPLIRQRVLLTLSRMGTKSHDLLVNNTTKKFAHDYILD